MKKLEAKTKEQQDYIAALVEEESCDGEVKVCEGGIDYTVDQCFGVGMSFDTMAKIVDYLRKESVSEDLEEAAKEYAIEQVLCSTDTRMTEQAYLGIRLFNGYDLACAYKDGAENQREQMMKGAIDGYIRRNKYFKENVLHGLDVTCAAIQQFKDGDKVKILVIKQE